MNMTAELNLQAMQVMVRWEQQEPKVVKDTHHKHINKLLTKDTLKYCNYTRRRYGTL